MAATGRFWASACSPAAAQMIMTAVMASAVAGWFAGCGAGAAREPAQPVTAARLSHPVLVLHREGALVTAPGQPGRATDRLTWQVHYLLILETADPDGHATLRATLELTNHGDETLGGVVLPLSDREHEDPPAEGTDRLKKLLASPLASRPIALEPWRTLVVPLLPERGLAVRTAARLFYDPLAAGVISESATPVVRRDHAWRPPDIAHPHARHAVQLALADAGIPALPAGPLAVFRRQDDGELAYLGTDPEFGARPFVAVAHAVLGMAQGVDIIRRQTDYAFDLHARRLLEEIRLEVHNGSERDQVVIAHEHLARGLNWSIAYHNEAGTPRKVAPQTLRFDIPVPAGATATVVYRVVYTWDDPGVAGAAGIGVRARFGYSRAP